MQTCRDNIRWFAKRLWVSMVKHRLTVLKVNSPPPKIDVFGEIVRNSSFFKIASGLFTIAY